MTGPRLVAGGDVFDLIPSVEALQTLLFGSLNQPDRSEDKAL